MTYFQCQCKNLAQAIEDAADDWESLSKDNINFTEKEYEYYAQYRAIQSDLRSIASKVIKFKQEVEHKEELIKRQFEVLASIPFVPITKYLK